MQQLRAKYRNAWRKNSTETLIWPPHISRAYRINWCAFSLFVGIIHGCSAIRPDYWMQMIRILVTFPSHLISKFFACFHLLTFLFRTALLWPEKYVIFAGITSEGNFLVLLLLASNKYLFGVGNKDIIILPI